MSIDSRHVAAVKKLEQMGFRWSDATGDWEPPAVPRPVRGVGVCYVAAGGGGG